MNVSEKIQYLAKGYVYPHEISEITGTSLDTLVNNICLETQDFQERVIGSEKFIEHPELNKQGLHLFRCLAANCITWEHRFLNYNTHPLYEEFDKNGILVLQNKYHWYEKPDQELWDLLSMCAGKCIQPQPFRENVFTHFTGDIQYQLHSDTFQPNVKSWMYLQDINIHHGPTNFIYGSHDHDTIDNLKWLYSMSTLPPGHPDIRDGSFPLFDYKKWGFAEPKPVVGQKGTYVIVDTCGIHCRGFAKPGIIRRTAKLHYRFNPFDLMNTI